MTMPSTYSLPIERRRFLVNGRVQGVGFRNFVQHHAMRLGLSGFVRNLPNGDVELEAQGDGAKLLKLMELLKKGPSFSTVDGVFDVLVDTVPDERDFSVTWN